MWYLYILKSIKDSKLYIGSTSDVNHRLGQHNKGLVTSTKHRRPWVLIYFEAYLTEHPARLRESKLKQFGAAYQELKKRVPEMQGCLVMEDSEIPSILQ